MPAVAGSGHCSPGGWHRLNCRMASELIRNAGKRLVSFSKELPPPLFPPFFPGGAGAMGRNVHNYFLVHLHGDSQIDSPLLHCSRKGAPRAKCFPWRGGPSSPLPSCPPPTSFCDVSQEVTGCLHCLQVPRQGMQLLRSTVAFLPSDDPGCSFSPPQWTLVSRLPHAVCAALIGGKMLMLFCFLVRCFSFSSYLGVLFL